MYGYSVKEHKRFLISSEPEVIEFMADTAISVATSLVSVASRLSPESGSVVSRAREFVLNELDFDGFEVFRSVCAEALQKRMNEFRERP
mmetsp:Transcript_1175/g.3416  ORF Transcript_1175/g.3416 Transcript_1175/m.3416 type:complete len:89 (-) Transcript_1175:1983-2249(-)